MKKAIIFVCAVIGLSSSAQAIGLRFGAFFGIRTLNDSALKDIYGQGTVLYPYLSVELGKGFGIGVSYELYNRSGTVKPYSESTQLKINGKEIFLSYTFYLGTIRPYIHAGFGSYSYNQTIVSDYLAGYSVNAKSSGLHFAGGVVFTILKPVQVSVEAKYVPLNVHPFEDKVDLGGWRFSAGLGLAFEI